MSGYVQAMSACFGCKRVFTYNPHKVPSIVIDGTREPVCADCVARANPERAKRGLAPIEILPGAYDPLPEGEL